MCPSSPQARKEDIEAAAIELIKAGANLDIQNEVCIT